MSVKTHQVISSVVKGVCQLPLFALIEQIFQHILEALGFLLLSAQWCSGTRAVSATVRGQVGGHESEQLN
jgi:hypothetical protein